MEGDPVKKEVDSEPLREDLVPQKDPTVVDIILGATKSFSKAFLSAYTVKLALLLAPKILKLITTRKAKGLTLRETLGDSGVLRTGAFVGAYSGIYRLLVGLLNKIRGDSKVSNTAVAAAVAGLAIMIENPDQRREIAHNLVFRAMHAMYRIGVTRELIRPWKHGNTLVFVLSSAQVMYAYAKHPETLPPAYYKFIVETGPIPELVMQQARNQIQGLPIDIEGLNKFIFANGGPANALSDPLPLFFPSVAYHPGQPNKILNIIKVFVDSFGKTLPLYLTLTFIPALLFQPQRLLKRPLEELLRIAESGTRSTAFLASLVSSYMAVVSLVRKLLEVGFADIRRDNKLSYYLAGVIASFSILLESKSRRTELALYCLPRAVDSLFQVMAKHGWSLSVPHSEVAVFSLSMAAIMHCFEHEDDGLTGLLRTLMKFFVR